MTLLCNFVVFLLGFCMILFILWETDTDAIYFLFDDDGQVVCVRVCVRVHACVCVRVGVYPVSESVSRRCA